MIKSCVIFICNNNYNERIKLLHQLPCMFQEVLESCILDPILKQSVLKYFVLKMERS